MPDGLAPQRVPLVLRQMKDGGRAAEGAQVVRNRRDDVEVSGHRMAGGSAAGVLVADVWMLTGVSLPVGKRPEAVAADAELGDRASMAHAGSLVVRGRGRGIAVAVGDATELGGIGALVASADRLATADRSAPGIRTPNPGRSWYTAEQPVSGGGDCAHRGGEEIRPTVLAGDDGPRRRSLG